MNQSKDCLRINPKIIGIFLFILLTILSSSLRAESIKDTTKDIKVCIIVGGQREQSESRRIAGLVEKDLKQQGTLASVVDLQSDKLPLWEEPSKDKLTLGQKIWQDKISPKLSAADAFVIITPEYNGGASPALKNFFLYLKQELAHKPALLIGLSAGHGGAYPLAELRATSHKDTFIVYMPGNVIIREVRDRLKTTNKSSEIDQQIQERLVYSLKLLEQYGIALKKVRESGVIDLNKFPMGQ